jgi:hypothetical protein
MKDVEADIAADHISDGPRQRLMLIAAPIVEDLDVKLVSRPFHASRRTRDPDRQRAFVAHRQLDQHFGQNLIGKIRGTQPGLCAEMPDKTECGKLHGQDGKRNEHACEDALKS